MHRLRTKKSKGPKDEAENESSGGGLLSFKRGKNAPPPAKPVIDIAAALPSTDDFRTSLLMPNLAQRFSILAHEQSDSASQSSSKSGNNDALASFNFSHNFSGSGLPDIAETGSISGSITGKNGAGNACSRDSHTSDESTSIMNRSRPGEGNVLFGGRQKVYRVVASSARDSSEDSREPRSLGGRVYYDNDISDSTFARKEKKRYENYEQEEKEDEEVQEHQQKRSSSPSHNNNRNTSSSTNSTPTDLTRSSTAATSVNSQQQSGSSTSPGIGSTQSAAKPRRPLYEQALEEQLQENSSKLDIFTSQRRLGAMSPPPTNSHSPVDGYSGQRSGAASPTVERNNFYDNFHNQPSAIAVSGALSTFNFGLDTKDSEAPGFSQKVVGYDDDRYHLVQQQKLAAQEQHEQNPAIQIDESVQESNVDDSQILSDRRLSTSSAESHSGGLQWEKLSFDTRSNRSLDVQTLEKRQSKTESHQTFLSTPSSDESEYEYDVGDESFESLRSGKPVVGLGLQSEDGNPEIAPLRPRKHTSRPSTSGSDRHSTTSTIEQQTAINGEYHSDKAIPITNGKRPLSPISPHLTANDEDSPTLPPVQGLSVLVRQHLRTDSGRSSIYAASTYTSRSRISRQNTQTDYSSTVGQKPSGVGKLPHGNDPAMPSGASGSSGGNLWEFDDWDGGYYGEDQGEPESPSSLTHPAFRKRSGESDRSVVEEVEDGANGKRDGDDWARGKEQVSDRSGNQSSDDDQDRDWEDELAHRKRLVQANLREHESRSNSPVPEFARETRPRSPGPLESLKKKTSNGMLNSEGGSKAMRMLSMGGGDLRDEFTRQEEERLRETVRGVKNLPLRDPRGQYPPHPQDRDFRQGPHFMHPSQRPHQGMPPHMGNRQPAHVDEHPAMRQRPHLHPGPPPQHGPPGGPHGPPHGLPVPGRSPMRGPSLRSQPSRERLQNRDNSPRLMSPPRGGDPLDPRLGGDRQYDGPYGPPHRSPNPNSPNPNFQGPRGTPRMGPPRMGGNGNWDGPLDRRPPGPMGPMGRPMHGPMGRSGMSPEGHDGHPMGRGDRGYVDDARMLSRNPSRMGGLNEVRNQGRDEMAEHRDRRQGPYSPEQSPPPTRMQSKGNSNAQTPSLTRQRSESTMHREGPSREVPSRDGPSVPPIQTSPLRDASPIQTSPPRNAPPPLSLKTGVLSPAASPQVGKFPGGLQKSPVPPTPTSPPSAVPPNAPLSATPLSAAKSIGFPSSPNPAALSPALSSASSPNPASAAYAKLQSFQQHASGPAAKKRVVNKSKISEPKLIASTSNIPTIPLPLTPTSARRKRRQTTTIFGGFGKNHSSEKMPSDGEVEKSSFQMDEPKKEKVRAKLRKSTSDGGGLRARREAEKNAPATPSIPQLKTGGMI